MEGRQGCGKIIISISNFVLYDKFKMCEQGAAKQFCRLILEILFGVSHKISVEVEVGQRVVIFPVVSIWNSLISASPQQPQNR